MPTAKWDRPEQLFGYLDEEERVVLEPLLGSKLYQHVLNEHDRLVAKHVDITATTIEQNGKARWDPGQPYADVTERLDAVSEQRVPFQRPCIPDDETDYVAAEDMNTINLIRICQRIEFYKMLSHKAGMLTVSFNEGGGMNVVSTDGYEPADDKRIDRLVKDAYMSAGRAIDSLLLFLESDAKGKKQFSDMWKEADAFYLHKDLLFQTARALNEYLDIRMDRMAYVSLVRDIRFCQNTYLKPNIGAKLLKAVIDWSNGDAESDAPELMSELLSLLRTALAFYVESRKVTKDPSGAKMARRDSVSDGQQALAAACEYIREHIDELGAVAVGTPIYNAVQEQRSKEARAKAHSDADTCRRKSASHDCRGKRLFSAFPATQRTPEFK